MIYLNMGHNDVDYEHRYDTTNRPLSHTFGNPSQDRLIIEALTWLGKDGSARRVRNASPVKP